MQKFEGGKQIGVIVHEVDVARLDEIANKNGLTRAETARRILGMGLDVYDDMSSVGLLKLIEIIDKTKQAVQDMYCKPRQLNLFKK